MCVCQVLHHNSALHDNLFPIFNILGSCLLNFFSPHPTCSTSFCMFKSSHCPSTITFIIKFGSCCAAAGCCFGHFLSSVCFLNLHRACGLFSLCQHCVCVCVCECSQLRPLVLCQLALLVLLLMTAPALWVFGPSLLFAFLSSHTQCNRLLPSPCSIFAQKCQIIALLLLLLLSMSNHHVHFTQTHSTFALESFFSTAFVVLEITSVNTFLLPCTFG